MLLLPLPSTVGTKLSVSALTSLIFFLRRYIIATEMKQGQLLSNFPRD